MKRGARVDAKTGIGVQSERSWGNMEEDGGRGNRRDGELGTNILQLWLQPSSSLSHLDAMDELP